MKSAIAVLFLVAGALPGIVFAGSLPDGPYVSTSASAIEAVDPDYAVIDLQFRVVESSSDEARSATNRAQQRLAEAQGSRLGKPWGIIFEPMHELAGRSPGVAGSEMQRLSLGVGAVDAEFAIPMMPRPVEFEARVGVVYRLEPGPE